MKTTRLAPIFLTLALSIFFISGRFIPNPKANPKIKFHPGHYVAVGPSMNLSDINHLKSPALKGVNKRYTWRRLEIEKGKYNLASIESDLNYCAKENKQLVVLLCDRSFWIKGALPSYLQSLEIELEEGFCPQRWHPEFVERFVAMGQAIGDAFDNHPNFEGIAIQETAMDIPTDVLKRFNYSPEKYREAIKSILSGLQASLPNSQVFWYQNGFYKNDGHLREIANSVSGSNVVMGGPDILPHRKWLRETYKIYPEFKAKLPLFCSAQDDSYRHHSNDTQLAVVEPVPTEGYMKMEDIFQFARDSMHVQYIFWNHYYNKANKDEWSFDDAIKVIQNQPAFNTTY